MREIKFRAWEKEREKMIPFDRLVIFGDQMFSQAIQCWQKAYEIMQFTGLKDKNGVEIYEGDIVKVVFDEIHKSIHQVKWGGEYDYPAFDLDPDLEVEANGLQHCVVTGEATIEVIGNIYENPGLLKT